MPTTTRFPLVTGLENDTEFATGAKVLCTSAGVEVDVPPPPPPPPYFESVETTTSVGIVGVTLIEGLPPLPFADITTSSGQVGDTPVNDDAPSRMAVVEPLMVTDIVLEPVVVATRYQTSLSIAFVRVLVAFVNAPPFHVADAIEPVPVAVC